MAPDPNCTVACRNSIVVWPVFWTERSALGRPMFGSQVKAMTRAWWAGALGLDEASALLAWRLTQITAASRAMATTALAGRFMAAL